MTHPMTPLRCVLFFPATRPDRHAKALATGADAVCMDLEDAIAPADKDQARAEAIALLQSREPHGAATILRVNDPQTALGGKDLDALANSESAPDAIMLPKVDGPDAVLEVERTLDASGLQIPLLPVIETARGLSAVEEISTCSSSISAILFGGVDLSTELGATIGWDELRYSLP